MSHGSDPHTRKRSVGLKDRVETDGWTDRQMDGGDCIIASGANAIDKNSEKCQSIHERIMGEAEASSSKKKPKLKDNV